MTRWLLRLYPAAWRKRYGDELEELMNDTPRGWRTAFDLFKGAMTMRLKRESAIGLVLGVMAVSGAAAWVASYLIPQVWQSTAVSQIHGPGGTRSLIETVTKARDNVTSRRSLANLINDPRRDLYRNERRKRPLEDIEDTMRANTHITIRPQTTKDRGMIFALSFSYGDPVKARDTTNALINRLTQELKGQNLSYVVEVIDAPVLPAKPAAPKRSAYTVAGVFTGLILALATLFIRRRTPPPGPGVQSA